MPQITQIHRLASSQAAAYTGPSGELLGDTGANTIRYQDGVTLGGHILMQGSNNLGEVSNPVAALANLGAAPLANPNFTGTPKINGDTICTLTAAQVLANKSISLSQLTDGGTLNIPTSTIDAALFSSSGIIAYSATGFGAAGNINPAFQWINNGVQALSVICNTAGVELNPNATAWTAVSDIRDKDDIKDIKNAINKVRKLRGVTFRYKNDKKNYKRRVGVIAQELQKVLPEAVYKDKKTSRLRISLEQIVPLLIQAINEQNKRIQILENK